MAGDSKTTEASMNLRASLVALLDLDLHLVFLIKAAVLIAFVLDKLGVLGLAERLLLHRGVDR